MKIKINFTPKGSPVTEEEKKGSTPIRFDVGDHIVVGQPFYKNDTEVVSAATLLTVSEWKVINGVQHLMFSELNDKFYSHHYFNKA